MPNTSSALHNSDGFRPPRIPQIEVSGFWGNWIDVVAEKTVMILYERCLEAGMFEQIDPSRPVPAQRIPFGRRPDGTPHTVTAQMFWDSDVAKVIESAAYSLYRRPNPELEQKMDEVIDMFARLQQPDGYMNSWFIRMQPGLRWTNVRDCHELYCVGHLIEAAVAYHQSTGKRKLLDVLCRYADHIAEVFGPGPNQKAGYCGHEEIELALVRLARETGQQRYMDLAKFFVDARGQQPHYFVDEAAARGEPADHFAHGSLEYNQSHLPVREQSKVVGHAVRAMYLYSAMADLAAEYGDDSLTRALELLWGDLTSKQMYITGGIGPQASNEGFTDYYDLPNASAYAETCASVGLVFWASRMLGRRPDRRYADVLEQALYNGALSGLSADGTQFFYDNPLESRGKHHRWTWHRCPCCPPNISRLIASIGTYAYSVSSSEIAVHLYASSRAKLDVGGQTVELAQVTEYPWDGKVTITVSVPHPHRFALLLRIPGWCQGARVSVRGVPVPESAIGPTGYMRIDEEWQTGDVIEMDLPMVVRALRANPHVRDDVGRQVMTRGPLVYCLEGADNHLPLNSLVVPRPNGPASTWAIADLGAARGFDLPAFAETSDDWSGVLYRTEPPELMSTTAHFVPYHLWDNRTAGEMLVWVRAQT